MKGPVQNQRVRCYMEEACAIIIEGSGLTTDDRIMPLANCGTGVAIYGFPQDGMATTKNGRVFTWGPERVMADVATSRSALLLLRVFGY